VSGDTTAALANTGSAYDNKNVWDATKVTVSGLSISGITGSKSSAITDYALDATSKDVAATISDKTVTLSGSKTYDGTTSLTGAVTLATGIIGEALTYTGATANDAHVATVGKYVNTITLADGTGLASNYTLPTLNVANAPVTISTATLTPTLTNNPVTKTYDGNTNAPAVFTPTYSFSGLVSGDTTAALANTGSAYDNKNVLDATKVTVSGLSISGITGSKSSAITDYALDATSKDVAATISDKTVTLSGSKTYDGTTSLTGAVTLATGIIGEALTYTGATANDAHVATVGKYVNTITLADGTGLASNYTLPTLNVANAPVTISTATLTPTLTNNPVTKTYDGNTNAPAVFTPTYSFSGLVSGDTTAALANTGSAYDNKNVLDATKVTVSGLSISGITGSKSSAITDYALDATSKDVAATISDKTVTLSGSKTYDGTTSLTGAVTLATGIIGEALTYTGATANDAHVATVGKYVNTITLADGTGLASNYTLPTLNVANAPVTISTATLTPTLTNNPVTKTYDGNTNAPAVFTPTYSFSGLVSGDTTAALANTGSAYDNKNVLDATKVTVSGLSISGITGSKSSAITDYALDATSKDVAATISDKTVTLSGSKTYDGTTSLTGAVTLATGIIGEALTYTGATANDAHVATVGKYVNTITLADGTGLASNYTLPTLNVANAPVTISTATLTPTLTNNPVTKTYDGNTNAPAVFTPTYSFSGLVSGDTTAALANTGSAYDNKNVLDATKVTVSGLSISGITGSKSSAITDYALDATSKDVAATISDKTVTLSGSKTYDGTTSLTGAVTLATGIIGEALTYTGATANDAHVATVGKYVNTITLADGTGLASNYTLPTLNVANAPVTISTATLTPTLTNNPVTKTYDGNTNAPAVFTPTYSFSGLVSGDTTAALANTGSAYDNKNVLDATKVTVSGLSISGITGSKSSDKTVTLSGSKTYDGTTSLTGAVTLATGIIGEALTYTGATANDAHVTTVGKYVNTITLADGTGLASNYTLPTLNVANAPVTISTATLTPTLTNNPVTKTYDGNTNAPAGFTPTYSFSGLVSGDTTAALANTGSAYENKNVLNATKVTVSGLSITGITGSKSSAITDYALDATSKDVAATISDKTVTLSGSKTYDGTTSLTGAVTLATGIIGEALTYTGATANDAHVATVGKYVNTITLADGTGLASNYTLPTLNVANAPVTISTATLTPTLTNNPVTKTYDGNTNAPAVFTPTYSFSGLVSGDTTAALAN